MFRSQFAIAHTNTSTNNFGCRINPEKRWKKQQINIPVHRVPLLITKIFQIWIVFAQNTTWDIIFAKGVFRPIPDKIDESGEKNGTEITQTMNEQKIKHKRGKYIYIYIYIIYIYICWQNNRWSWLRWCGPLRIMSKSAGPRVPGGARQRSNARRRAQLRGKTRSRQKKKVGSLSSASWS